MKLSSLNEIETLSKKFDETNIPQYLSYPTSNWWKSRVNGDTFIEKFSASEISYLYFHFPYCKTPCYFCMCYRKVAAAAGEEARYLAYLTKEIEQKTGRIGSDALAHVRHIHWGGGTPTLLSLEQMEGVFHLISNSVHIEADATLSIEAYPDDTVVTPDKLKLLRELGFNQISFGVQDFDARIQKTINRDCHKHVVTNLVEESRKLGFRVNIDLCYGLPFQGLNELESTLAHVLELSPDRVQLLAYAHYPVIFPLQRKIPASSIPNSFIRVLLSMLAQDMLQGSGYHKVGYDHFVKPGDVLDEGQKKKRLIRDFVGYSVDQKKEFLGFGVSAISALDEGYFHNLMTLDAYFDALDAGKIPLDERKSHLFGGDDRIRNWIIQKDILTDFSIDKKRVEKMWGVDFDSYFETEHGKLREFEKDGLLDLADPAVARITPIGRHFGRHVAYAFDGYYNRSRDRRG